MATTYAYLVDPNKQYMTKSGTINVNGTLRVYDAATDDIVITYKDFNGTENEASIKLDNNGRAIVIADSARAYRLEVYDRYGSLQWTVSPLWCLAAGGGVNVHTTRVISTDGSIDVDQIDVGSTTTYDIGLAPSDSMEYLEWVKCNDENISNGTWYPTYAEGTMETSAGEGLQVGESRFYHITSTLKVDPTGNGINYETLSVSLIFNDGDEEHELIRRDFDIDNSVNDPTLCEFSYDFACPADGFIYIKVDGVNNFTQVDSELQVHRIYSGINAVPGSCAGKPWVSEYFEEKSSMSAYIPYSGLEYNQGGNITGISGSAIYAALDSGTVSAIASSYAESAISSISGWSADFSAISSKIDWSSSGVFQPSGDYQTAGDYAYNSAVSSKVDQSAFEQCCDEVHSALDEKLDKSASSEFQPSGQYVYESAYSSFSSEVTNNISSISSTVSGLTGQYIEQSASSMFQPSGNYASASDLSAYVPFSGIEGEGGRVTGISGSAIKAHEYTGINPVTVNNTADTISVEHRTLCVDSTMTAYTTGDSAVIGVNVAGLDISSKMDASASSLFYSTSNPSGFIDGASASAIASAYQIVSATATQLYAGTAYLTSVNGSPISAARAGNAANASMANSAYYDGTGRLISALPDEATVSSIASAYAESAASGKQDTLSFSYDDDKISAINGSALAGQGGGGGLVTAIGTSTSGITSINNSSLVDTAALHSADYSSLYVQEPLYISASGDSSYIGISGDIGGIDSATCSAIASAYAESAASGKLDSSSIGTSSYMWYQWVTSISGTPISAEVAHQSDNASSAMYDGDGRELTALAANSSLSSKLDSSASSSFYTTANESGYVDSAYVESQVSSKQDTLTFDWDSNSAISSINGSALAGQGAVTGDYVENSALDSATAHSATGSTIPLATGVSSISGQPLIPTYLANPTMQYGGQSTFAYMPASSMWTTADAATGVFAPLQYSTGACLAMNAGSYFKAYYKGNEWFVSNTQYGMLRGEIHQSRGLRIVASGANSASGFQLHPSGVNGVDKNGSAWQYGPSENNNLTSVYDTVSANSASWGGGGIDSATCSAIASSYAESAVSGKADSSALSSYALSADVSGTVDLVSTQSANWGGSALALSAGPGVKLEKVGNTLVASTDETVLWSGVANSTSFSGALSENIHNFKYLEIYAAPSTAYLSARANQGTKFIVSGNTASDYFYYVRSDNIESNSYWGEIMYVDIYNGGTDFTLINGCRWQNNSSFWTGIGNYRGAITNIIGIGRTAGV